MLEHEFMDGSLVVSLSAPFGSGKTTFLSMWKEDLDARRETSDATPKVILLNAWDSDFCGDPLLSILAGLLKAAASDKPEANEKTKRLREAAKDVGWFVTGLVNGVVPQITGADPLAAADLTELKKERRQPERPDFIKLYEERTKALAELKESLRAIFSGDSPKAFVFVDELDRCRPDYAVSYLETIKHIFDIHGLVFVLAIDYDHLGCSTRALFGNDLNFAEYFRKFAQRTVSLPVPDEKTVRKLAEHYVSRYIVNSTRCTLIGDLSYRVRDIGDLINALGLTPRQIQEMFRVIGHVVQGDQQKRGTLFACVAVGVILMAALSVGRPPLYHSIGKGLQNHLEVGKY